MRSGTSKSGKIPTGASRSVTRSGAPITLPPTRGPYNPRTSVASSADPSPSLSPIPSAAPSTSSAAPSTSSAAPSTSTSEATLQQIMRPAAARQKITIEQQGKLRVEGLEKRRLVLGALDAHDRTLLESFAHDGSDATFDEYIDIPLGMSAADPDDSDIEEVEAFDVARAGKTYTVIVDEVKGASYVSRVTYTNRWRNRQTRLVRNAQAWAVQWDTLADEYLLWKHAGLRSDIPPALGEATEGQSVCELEAVAWHWRKRDFKYVNTGERYINQILIRCGLLSPSPLIPAFAISLLTLESYRRLRLRSPRLSIQSFVRALCDTQGEVYHSYFYQAFSDVYDVYLEILRCVDRRVQRVLQHDSPDWRLRNSCPPCQYKLADEEPLEYDQLIALDGGMSLKRFASAGTASAHLHFDTDYIIPRSDVDKYQLTTKKRVKRREAKGKSSPGAGEVKEAKGKGTSKGKEKEKEKELTRPATPSSDEGADVDVETTLAEAGGSKGEAPLYDWVYKTVESSPADIAGVVSACVERWKANADDSKKGMFECFDESGIFISVCRHGFILVTTDIVASGELAKYPLAILAKLQEVFPDAKLLTAYDIGCAFEKTAAKAFGSTLRLRFVIPSMHGYAHNRACQGTHHPNYVTGTGIEDFETCERVFSHLNDVARTTRHASAYHRHQAIHHQMQQWDADKFLSLGTFLHNNYKQALSIISNFGDLFAQIRVLRHLSNNDFTNWLADELTYLSNLGKEPEETTLSIEYVTALDKLWMAQAKYDEERKNITSTVAQDGDAGKRRVKASYKAAASQVNHFMGQVEDLEAELDLATRWTVTSAEYVEAKKYLLERRFRLALDNLEKLIVQRLFELQKGHLENTGYKVRTLIAKHLKSRSQAIQTALKAYNSAARALNPPRPVLSYATIIDYAFLGEFDLLRGATDGIKSKPWANRDNRVLLDQYYKLVHAKEEIRRLNIEMQRLQTWIRDEDLHYQAVAATVAEANIPLSLEILEQALHKKRVNEHVLRSLKRIEALPEFTGKRGPGVRLGGQVSETEPTDHPMGEGDNGQPAVEIDEMDDDDDDENEELETQVDSLDSAFSRMAT